MMFHHSRDLHATQELEFSCVSTNRNLAVRSKLEVSSDVARAGPEHILGDEDW